MAIGSQSAEAIKLAVGSAEPLGRGAAHPHPRPRPDVRPPARDRAGLERGPQRDRARRWPTIIDRGPRHARGDAARAGRRHHQGGHPARRRRLAAARASPTACTARPACRCAWPTRRSPASPQGAGPVARGARRAGLPAAASRAAGVKPSRSRPRRSARWLEAGRRSTAGRWRRRAPPGRVTFTAADGARIDADPPFPPLPDVAHGRRRRPRHRAAARARGARPRGRRDPRAARARACSPATGWSPRRWAAGWSTGATQGRVELGRFARRRENQARDALGDAADVAARGPARPTSTTSRHVVLGGDRRALAGVMEDPRLRRPAAAGRASEMLDVARPAPERLRASPSASGRRCCASPLTGRVSGSSASPGWGRQPGPWKTSPARVRHEDAALRSCHSAAYSPKATASGRNVPMFVVRP